MATVRAIHVSPVKSLRLLPVDDARIEVDGIPGDRRFALRDERRAKVATQREIGALAQIASRYDPERRELSLVMPDGSEIAAVVDGGRPGSVRLWDRVVEGRDVDGPWSEAISEAMGRALTLIELTDGIRGNDTHAISLLSQASADEVGRRGGLDGLDARRFRPNLLLEGLDPHHEDMWVGRRVRAGDAVLSVIRLDPRCSLTTRNPDTGERDADTLRWLVSYRQAEDGDVNCGVYADVLEPGRVAVGDPVEPVGDAA